MSIERFEYGGINHLALVCRDMVETIRFYEGVLDMPLVKTIDLPDSGQHFFFDIGNNNLLAFFWFPDNDVPRAGTAAPASLPGAGDFSSDVSSMNHVALTVPEEKFEHYRDLLIARGLNVSEIMNHDYSKWQMSRRNHENVWLRSMYFFDPNGVLLEFACLTKKFTDADVSHSPRTAAGDTIPLDQARQLLTPASNN
ncbi:VOC family protein [Rhodococcus koreensis]